LLATLVALGCSKRPSTAIPPAEKARIDSAASKLEDAADELKNEERSFAVGDGRDFPQLDLAWYESSARSLQMLGYRGVGDLLDLDHNTKHPTARTFIRVLVSNDGNTVAGLYHYWDSRPEVRHAAVNDSKTLDLETEFDDGSFVITSNMPRQADLDTGPMIDRGVAAIRDPGALVALHATRVQAYLRRLPKLDIVPKVSMPDVIASEKREHALKARYRREMEIPFSEDELNNATDGRFMRVVRMVSDELRSRFPSW